MQVLETCSKPTALYMKLACDTAIRWKSFSGNTQIELRPTATELIIQLFERYVNPASFLCYYKEFDVTYIVCLFLCFFGLGFITFHCVITEKLM